MGNNTFLDGIASRIRGLYYLRGWDTIYFKIVLAPALDLLRLLNGAHLIVSAFVNYYCYAVSPYCGWRAFRRTWKGRRRKRTKIENKVTSGSSSATSGFLKMKIYIPSESFLRGIYCKSRQDRQGRRGIPLAGHRSFVGPAPPQNPVSYGDVYAAGRLHK